eukprot:CAMPEP_0181297768 /NCGR_PEP_ID=MMETSP1101-20121128/5421_1 /TAXON_ID=46948 /ORGANISM="Rhodomonas abbreviata, Strain Caron Lab Isolate" /LENGTH=229 /DNA_ID=CAMNT_0023402737 /DNA_START=29 /DNA_END=716 /DNA_ORIENTATION=-
MSDGEEDPRIEQLEEFIVDKSPKDIAEFLEKMDMKEAMVCGGMCFNIPFAKAHFMLSATLGSGTKLTEEIIQAKEIYKACFPSEEAQLMLLFALEMYVVTKKRNGLKVYDAILRCLWENDVIHEDQMDKWHKAETGLHQFYPDFALADAVKARETGWKFIDWVQREDGDDGEDEEDEIQSRSERGAWGGAARGPRQLPREFGGPPWTALPQKRGTLHLNTDPRKNETSN